MENKTSSPPNILCSAVVLFRWVETKNMHRFLPLILFIFSLSYNINFTIAITGDTISPTHPIRDGDFIVSNNGTFKLGFFSLPNNTNRYVGIWYAKISVQTYVWIANRDNPIKHSSGVLRIEKSGNLTLFDGGGNIVWSVGQSSTNSTAVLLDSGNLILKEANTSDEVPPLWQSYDDPTDTLLPNMKLSVNLTTHVKKVLRSWSSANDPGSGDYTSEVDSTGARQLFVCHHGVPYFRSGEYQKRDSSFDAISQTTESSANVNNTFARDKDEVYFTNNFEDSVVPLLVRAVIDYEGTITQFVWSDTKQKWDTSWAYPRLWCDTYNRCGAYSICRDISCSCLPGFANVSGGCKRRTELKRCNDDDEFLLKRNMKLPDRYNLLANASLDINDCNTICLGNCSCTAYASAYTNGTGCIFWGGELIDLAVYDGGNDLYYRVAASEHGGNKKRTVAIIIIASFGALLCVTLFYLKFRNTGRIENIQERTLLDLGTSSTDANEFAHENELGEDLPLFSFSTVVSATCNFSHENKLGEGGFGPVYKVIIKLWN
ncbi:G-type lectin S-receptor-like serine/threonine-protein kinase [Acorus calamus]|uniref:G-type lectin S-receptor-like serine/threonine-protein kinase n=1 Tax=Acorus calamus TaxID=4465 RepID=A0AAV9FL57_ACOCL|nr:G-type lectin S-receptor-like serine/threonine-protein kinase [Acorus calamus]